ncbi:MULTISPECIES: hypothetical protein [Paraclostridium]|uniref:Uncharacterized protein n=2 Tax=Paraclostridium bifermentans TaxID=1490 RepID=A0A5P3XHQ1_PARBF|nr:hypothetical protein [Paraclostridium bifermentans]MBZ6006524.1 hypothetical protein [Paraclostridium bifermentans]MCE9675486.1 hypothetical protein [Paraclostridium bifermentans]MCR1876022.1 hypothetical protein [Paraclostridium bifermentans]NME07914.1 hypothetical protein [Paraclostridium bifermentans]QEZ69878.1 hypothetical protein D4A35_13670 [Paraclostridium bifermentans]
MKYIKGGIVVMAINFEEVKTKFINGDLDEKIRIYTTTEGLSVEQFRELLKYYPIQHLSKLEKALG